jgi:hypothetical protein
VHVLQVVAGCILRFLGLLQTGVELHDRLHDGAITYSPGGSDCGCTAPKCSNTLR